MPVLDPTKDITYLCIHDLITRVQSIAAATGIVNVITCLSMADLQTIITGTAFPAVGVMYAGQASYITGVRGPPKTSHQVGLASKLNLSLILLVSSKKVLGTQQTSNALVVLKAMRDSIKDSLGPSQHYWKFISEVPAGETGNVVAWQQNWEIPILLT